MFKAGDKIRCIKDDNTFPGYDGIKLGDHYTVVRMSGGFVYLIDNKGLESYYHESRFELINNMVTKPVARIALLNTARKLKCQVEFLDFGTNYFMVRFISDTFGMVSQKKRHEVIQEALEKNPIQILKYYEVVFDAFTPIEIQRMLNNA